MTFKEELKEKLNGKVPADKLDLLPSGFQAIGEICILNLNKELENYKRRIGEAVLLIFKRFKTVCNKKGEITGKFREPQIEVIAGDEKTEAIVKENDCLYKFDVTKIMFAKGNINERVRIARQVKPREVVVDMFAGIGYFSVPIGRLASPEKIYSIELNPNSIYYLKENLRLNKIEDKFEVIHGDCKEEVDNLIERGVKADRVVMGYLPPPMEFVPWALKIVKNKGIVHYEDILNLDDDKRKHEVKERMEKIEEFGKEQGKKVKLISVNYVKDYRPHVGHYVLDILVD
jgi:tRNA wybutosine-synthesizing protein 2